MRMKIAKYSGLLLIYTGILHTLVGLFLGKNVFWDMIKSGLVNSVDSQYDRRFGFWFLICGFLIIFLGQMVNQYIKRTRKPAPASLGYSLLIMAIIGCIMVPLSGLWLFSYLRH